MFRKSSERNAIDTDYERWRGSVDQQLEQLDRQGARIEDVLKNIQSDVRDVLKWRYMIGGGLVVATTAMSAVISLLVKYLAP